MVRSGLRHVCIGVERNDDEDLVGWGKKFYSHSQSVRTFDLLKRKYPEVFRQATFIVGLRNETRESLRRQLDFARRIDADYPAFHPATPFPAPRSGRRPRPRDGWRSRTSTSTTCPRRS